MSLDTLREVETGGIWKSERPAAYLTRHEHGVRFHYKPEYGGPPIAWSLPREEESIDLRGGALPPFFSGLLPEGRRLRAIRTATKTSADDDLTLLLAVGGDAIGDVRVLPIGATPATDREEEGGRSLGDISFGDLYSKVLAAKTVDRPAIAGVQDNVSSAMISLPVRYAGAAWILKLDPPKHPHLVANEAFFLAAAQSSGISTAHAEIVHDRPGTPGLLVQRFDREPVEDGLRALAVEDACQVLGRYPADKYRLSTEEVLRGLAIQTGAPLLAARTLIHQFTFAFATCNGDAHAKNFSILNRDDEWQATPAHDLPSSHPYGDTTMTLSLNGKLREDIGRADFLALTAHCSVPAKAIARVLDAGVKAAPTWLDRIDELPFDSRANRKLGKACSYRVRRLTG